MGWGDGVLMLSFGWLLGLSGGVAALLVAFWSGAIVGLALMFPWWRGGGAGFTMKSAIPFAPFLALGAAAAHFYHVNVFSALLF